MIHKLAEQLNRRLRAIRLEGGHVEIVDEDDAPLAHGRAEDALTPLVELAVDNVLRLVGGRLCRVVDEDGRPLGRLEAEEELLDVDRLSGAGRPDKEDGAVVPEQDV